MISSFCPNPNCTHHFDENEQYHSHWKHDGSYETQVVGTVPRFRCMACDCGFSKRTFIHETWPSTAPRTVLNPRFPVNYYDRELRKDIAAFRRESPCCTRNTANGLARFMAHLVYHNYQKPHRVGPGRQTEEVHAEMAGIPRGRIDGCLGCLYKARPFLSKQSLSPEAGWIWRKEAVTPLKVGSSCLPKYAR
jgi:hypothetical protein